MQRPAPFAWILASLSWTLAGRFMAGRLMAGCSMAARFIRRYLGKDAIWAKLLSGKAGLIRR